MGANPNFKDKKGDSPLHWLARRGNYTSSVYVLAAGGNPRLLNHRARNPLMEACDTRRSGKQVRLVRLLLEQKVMRREIEAADSYGNTALLNAVYMNNPWIVRELLLHGARVSDDLPGSPHGSAYGVALWIFCAGLLMDVDQLPPNVLNPPGCLYRYFSPEGHYEYRILMYIQSLYKYNAELVFRMVQRKKIFEDREPKPPRREQQRTVYNGNPFRRAASDRGPMSAAAIERTEKRQ
jgi:Ankyrin repeats (3 copies)